MTKERIHHERRGGVIKLIIPVGIIGAIFIMLGNWAYATAQPSKPMESESFPVASETCGSCHPRQYQEWKESYHAKSLTTPTYRMMLKLAQAETGNVKNCIYCHSPQTLLEGTEFQTFTWEEVRDQVLKGEVKAQGISCNMCHAIESTYSGFDPKPKVNLKPGATIYGPYKDAVSPYHDTAYSEVYGKSEFCASCHEWNQGANIRCCTVYSTWLNSPLHSSESVEGRDKGVVSCQTCHMPELKNQSAAVGGQSREKLNAHLWKGGRSPEMVKGTATLEVALKQLSSNKVLALVKVHNAKAGHKFPDGCPWMTEMKLQVNALDDRGGIIFEGSRTYSKVGRSADGRAPVPPFMAVELVSDTALRPNEARQETFEFDVSEGTQSVRVEAVLNYHWIIPPTDPRSKAARKAILPEDPEKRKAMMKKMLPVLQKIPGAVTPIEVDRASETLELKPAFKAALKQPGVPAWWLVLGVTAALIIGGGVVWLAARRQ